METRFVYSGLSASVTPEVTPTGLRVVTISTRDPLTQSVVDSVVMTPCEASRLGAALIAAAIECDLIAHARWVPA